MNDVYIELLEVQREKAEISPKLLCEGICSEDMYYKIVSGECSIDRVSVKRLMARIGVDSGKYENYLDGADYQSLVRRKEIINSVENGELDRADKLLKQYVIDKADLKNESRISVEEQFCIFMNLQIIRNVDYKRYEKEAKGLYEQAVKNTVPNVDGKSLNKMLLSPLEVNLVLEYESRIFEDKTLYEKINMYREIYQYILSAKFGKLYQIKVLPKTLVYMYRGISKDLMSVSVDEQRKIYDELWRYSEESYKALQERQSMLYMLELLQVRLDILAFYISNSVDRTELEKCKEMQKCIAVYIETLKEIYQAYGLEVRMTNDCYLYRESGVYSVSEVVKNRRNMLGLSQEDLMDENISLSTIKRAESPKKSINPSKFKILFDKLSLYPGYMNLGIVTDSKEAVDMYEELRFAIVRCQYDNVARLVKKLRDILPIHKINEQTLCSAENFNAWVQGEISDEQYVEALIKVIEHTIKMDNIRNAERIFLTTEELTALTTISNIYKQRKEYDKAKYYIADVEKYLRQIEGKNTEDECMGICEMVMECIANLYGDIERFDESNNISHKLIKMSLRFRRSTQIHNCLYCIAWNNRECKMEGIDYHAELQRCIIFSQLSGDIASEEFFKNMLTEW